VSTLEGVEEDKTGEKIVDSNISAQITITLNKEGQIFITGPLHDKVLCYGLLKVGEVLVTEYNKVEEVKKVESKLIVPVMKVKGTYN